MFLEIQVIFSGQSCVLKEHCYPVVDLYLICWCTWTRSSAERILVVVILSWGNWLFLAFKKKNQEFFFGFVFLSLQIFKQGLNNKRETKLTSSSQKQDQNTQNLKKTNAYFDNTEYVHIFKLDPFFWAMNRPIIITQTNDVRNEIRFTYFSVGNQVGDEGFENCMIISIELLLSYLILWPWYIFSKSQRVTKTGLYIYI